MSALGKEKQTTILRKMLRKFFSPILRPEQRGRITSGRKND